MNAAALSRSKSAICGEIVIKNQFPVIKRIGCVATGLGSFRINGSRVRGLKSALDFAGVIIAERTKGTISSGVQQSWTDLSACFVEEISNAGRVTGNLDSRQDLKR